MKKLLILAILLSASALADGGSWQKYIAFTAGQWPCVPAERFAMVLTKKLSKDQYALTNAGGPVPTQNAVFITKRKISGQGLLEGFNMKWVKSTTAQDTNGFDIPVEVFTDCN